MEILDLDPDAVTREQVAALSARGIMTICYVSVGTVEDWRADAGQFPEAVIGRRYGEWPDERYLDMRAQDVLLPLMEARFQTCKDKGFDAIEPDNMDIYDHNTGFGLTAGDAIAYVKALADLAHGMGLQIGQKTAPELVPDLEPVLDFVLFEECHEQGYCAAAAPYVAAGKPALNTEYRLWGQRAACAEAQALGLATIFKRRELGVWRKTCP